MEYAVPCVTHIICPIVLQDFYDDTFYRQRKSGGNKTRLTIHTATIYIFCMKVNLG